MASAETIFEEDVSDESGSERDSNEEDETKFMDSCMEDRFLSSEVEESEEEEEEEEEENRSSGVLRTEEELWQVLESERKDSRKLLGKCGSKNPELRKCLGFLKKLSLYIWKSISQAMRVSLLNDFVESELFVIDGDSLLLMWLYEEKEYLPFFYLVECFLLDFTQKGAKYIIVLFKDAEQLYHNYPHMLFLHTTLIQHLKQNTDIDIHTEFFNCLSPEWQIFLKEIYPYFMIISDTGLTSLQTDYLQILISHTLSKKINVVLTSGQESDTLRVHGYHVRSMYMHRNFFQQRQKDFQCALETLVKYLQNSQDTTLWFYKHLNLSLKSLQEEVCQTVLLLKRMWPEGSNIRQVFCVLTCAVGLKMYSHMLENANASAKEKEGKTEHFPLEEKTGALALEDAADLCRMQCLSVAFLFHLPLSQARIRITHSHWTQQVLPFIIMQQQCAYFILKQLTEESGWRLNLTSLPDLRDKSLLKDLAYYYETEYCTGLDLELGKDLKTEYQYLCDTVTTLAAKCNFGVAFPVRHTSQPFLEEKQKVKDSKEEIPNIRLIPLKSDVVKDYAGAVLEDLPFLNSDDPAVTSLIKEKEFDELRHWHSGKLLSDEHDRAPCSHDAKSREPEERRSIQKLQRFYRLYGRSLEGDISMTVVTQADVPLVPTSTNAVDVHRKKSHKSKAEIIREENQKQRKAKQEKKKQEQWEALSMLIENEIKEDVAFGINRLENFLKKCQSQSVKFSAEMAGLHGCFDVWKEHCRKQGKKSKDLSIAVQVMRRIHELLEKYEELLQKSHRQMLAKCLNYLGFENLACSLSSQITERNNEKIAKYATEVGAARFQLQYMGSYLFRDERSDPDPRVRHFIPDTWQRELLDIVDNNESAVIVAPTSSGKTYASYYCMEKVLKQSNEGVVVYVSPTKALINQVVATIYNRFTKTLPDGLTLCGVFTREYRHDVMNCQVLVTVPQCLEILLLSPHRQKWVKRIRYIIFDEVVLHGERYNDLEKYVCSLKDDDFVIEHYHPCAALTVNHIEKYGIPSDLALSPRESLQMYDTMVKVWQDWPGAQDLDPEEFLSFKNKIVIKKADARKYEDELKKELTNWTALGQKDKVNQLLECLKPHPTDGPENKKQIKFGHFVEKLQDMDKLPAIFFMFNSHSVEDLAIQIKRYLISKERRKKDPNIEREIGNLRTKLRKMDKILETCPSINSKRQTTATSKAENIELILQEKQQIQKRLENLTEIPPDCTYANSKAVDKQTLMKIFLTLRYERKASEQKDLAQRGIGYHHASVTLKRRQVVEMLFRMGYIWVVTATSTLALGINIPCKSVVFSEDSVYLDAVNYRQMSGRAGRHGQDLIGNVFFYDIPMPKVEKLIKSNVPQLKGNFPFSMSLVLRLMLLAAKADDKVDAKATVLSVLKHPLISFKQPRHNEMLKIYVIFSLQFLLKEVNFHSVRLRENNCSSTVFSEDVMETLVLVLANLFGKRYLPACAMNFRKNICQSKVFLEDLPEEFAAAADEYNSKVEKNFACFLLTTAKLADTEQEYKLPLSKIDFKTKEYDHSKLASHLMSSTKNVTAVSPFMCLSGMTDQDLFAAENVNKAVLRTVGVNIGNSPLLWWKKHDYQGRRMPLNAYALDFYRHGSLAALVKDNWLSEGDAYKLLKDLLLLIKDIRVSLGELCDNPDDKVVLAFQQLSESFEAKLNKV